MGPSRTHDKSRNIIKLYKEEAGVSNVWRVNPELKQFSWHKYFPEPSFGRIDYYLISDALLSSIEFCRYMPGFKTDHSFVELGIDTTTSPRGRRFWKFNAQHLDSTEYDFKIRHFIEKIKEIYKERTLDIIWEMIKCEVTAATIDSSIRS